MSRPEVVITGLGVVSPIGIGCDPFWRALEEGRSGVGEISSFDSSALPVRLAAEVRDFDPKQYVRPRKSLKVMARDTQFGVTAADLACADAGIAPGRVDPDRFGVVFGADMIATQLDESSPCFRSCIVDGRFDFSRWGTHGMPETFPLLFLKILPNMIASHIAIAQDARGPNNTLHENEVSSLMALSEAARVIERGWADCMLAGGASSRMQPFDWVRACVMDELARYDGDPREASRPFDRYRQGQVRGEGAAALVLESRAHAEARGARIRARLLGTASSAETHPQGKPPCGCGLERAIRRALADAGLEPHEIGHVNAHGLSTRHGDQIEAAVIRNLLSDVPVTAAKSFFGNLAAAGGAVELVASILALEHGRVPVTLNYRVPDEACPVNVVHREPAAVARPTALAINQTGIGQAAALVVARD